MLMPIYFIQVNLVLQVCNITAKSALTTDLVQDAIHFVNRFRGKLQWILVEKSLDCQLAALHSHHRMVLVSKPAPDKQTSDRCSADCPTLVCLDPRDTYTIRIYRYIIACRESLYVTNNQFTIQSVPFNLKSLATKWNENSHVLSTDEKLSKIPLQQSIVHATSSFTVLYQW